MRVGVTLPTFRDDAAALGAAQDAEEAGLDGVFVFDHLWPLGQPQRPALSAFPVLGAVAAATARVSLGPLVARVGLQADDLLVASLLSLAAMAPGRAIAALGTGDSKSAPENEAFGIPFAPAEERRRSLASCARRLRDGGVPVWVGGGARATTDLGPELGVAVNLWGADPAAVAAVASRCEVTWGGPVPEDASALAGFLAQLAEAGATWVVCAWPPSLEVLARAAAEVR